MRIPTVGRMPLRLPCGLRRGLPGRADSRWRGRRARRDHRPQPASPVNRRWWPSSASRPPRLTVGARHEPMFAAPLRPLGALDHRVADPTEVGPVPSHGRGFLDCSAQSQRKPWASTRWAVALPQVQTWPGPTADPGGFSSGTRAPGAWSDPTGPRPPRPRCRRSRPASGRGHRPRHRASAHTRAHGRHRSMGQPWPCSPLPATSRRPQSRWARHSRITTSAWAMAARNASAVR